MSSTSTFTPDRDIPDLSGKVILITGGTAGLGSGSILELVKHKPAHIFFSGRNKASADALIARVHSTAPQVDITFIEADISSLASVQKAASALLSATERLDILMLNAGIMAVPPALSADGYEIQFATNHLGHALLVKLLLPLLLSTASSTTPPKDVRIINLSSEAYLQAPSAQGGIAFASLKTPQDGLGGLIPGARWSRYGQAKLAQMLYSSQLALHHPQLTSVSVHPGYIWTGLITNQSFADQLLLKVVSIGKKVPVEEGHFNQVWAATVPVATLRNGEYYEPVGKVGHRKSKESRDVDGLGLRLWEWTEKELADWV